MSRNAAERSEQSPSETPLVEWSVHVFLVACWVLIVVLAFLGFAPRAAGDWESNRRVGLVMPVGTGGGVD